MRRYSFYEIFEFNQFINLIIIGVLIFSIIHKFGSNLEKRIPRFSKINYRRNDLILIISYFLYAIIRINILNIEGDIFKGISFLTSTFISGSIFGSLIAISKKNLIESYIKSIPYMLLLISQNIFINDNSSRIYALFYFVLIYSITIASRKNLIFSISFKLKKIINQIIFKIFYVVTLLFFLSFKSILTGGDYLIVENALNIMRIANSYKNFEPFMPFHNGLFIYFPQKILPFVKPENYNSSAWVIQNIYGLNPELTYGSGATMFGSSFLYGGYLGIIISFILLGIIILFIEKYVDSFFFLGFYIFIIMKLPLAIFRMDESFLLGTFITFILILPVFYKLIKGFLYK